MLAGKFRYRDGEHGGMALGRRRQIAMLLRGYATALEMGRDDEADTYRRKLKRAGLSVAKDLETGAAPA